METQNNATSQPIVTGIPPEMMTMDAGKKETLADKLPPTDGQTPSAATTQAPAVPSEYTTMGRKFKSADELVAYTKQLESMVAENTARQSGTATAPAVADTSQPTGKEFYNLVFEDPEKAFSLWEKKINDNISRREHQARLVNEFWDDFYKKNPDLKKHERLVQSELNRDQKRYYSLEVDSAKAELAKSVRGWIGEIKSGSEKETTLSSQAATTLGASGSQAPTPPATSEPSSFISQLNSIRRRGKKA